MALWRFLLVVALAFGSLVPHCAAAAPMPMAAHHAGMAHDQHQPAKAHTSDACIGCATPVRFMLATPCEPTFFSGRYSIVASTLRARVTALDPPPPRMDS
jgi:hypothetical protein